MVRLAQVVSNLLTNAVEHGAPSIPIEVVLDGSAADQVLLTIKNQGRPIPPEVIPHLFEAFRRGTEQVPTRGRGVGLGLYIAERIVTAHGGRISVHSSEAEGTTFVVELPRDAPEPAGSLS